MPSNTWREMLCHFLGRLVLLHSSIDRAVPSNGNGGKCFVISSNL
jgi:hypothetical protein